MTIEPMDWNNGPEAAALRAEIESLRQQLVITQRLSALGELTSTTAHEFNNILMTVMNYARMGLRQKDPAARERAFQRIIEAADRAAAITGSILGVARNRGQRFETASLEPLVRGVLLLLEKEMQKYRIAVETDFQPVPEVPVVASQIQQVLLNLLINARQAMSEGGRIIVRLRSDPETGFVDLTVRDFGVGIPAERLPRIFENGFSTKSGPDESGRGGAGVGLSACRAIVDAHHGRIRVDSTPGSGTAFTIRLPVRREPRSDAA